ncbi:tetraspanin-2 isoform X2 [Pleurodeles waltl]|uniref:tetraspanin-2 isoform X2 n=1 Tax=Pleurodeles waltl TaxID=8319 RepID=UPI003709500A
MGRVSGIMRCIKYLLCTFNFIFWLAGSAVTAIGLWLRFGGDITEIIELKSSDGNEATSFFTGLYVLIGAGVLMMLVGFFGCCGAIRESQCLLGSFFACLLVIFTAEMTAGVFVFLGKSTAIEEFQNIYTEALDDYKNGVEGSNTTLLSFHKIVGCCGKDSVEDMKHLCPKDLKVHKNCLEEIEKLMSSKLKTVGIVCIAVAGVTEKTMDALTGV